MDIIELKHIHSRARNIRASGNADRSSVACAHRNSNSISIGITNKHTHTFTDWGTICNANCGTVGASNHSANCRTNSITDRATVFRTIASTDGCTHHAADNVANNCPDTSTFGVTDWCSHVSPNYNTFSYANHRSIDAAHRCTNTRTVQGAHTSSRVTDAIADGANRGAD